MQQTLMKTNNPWQLDVFGRIMRKNNSEILVISGKVEEISERMAKYETFGQTVYMLERLKPNVPVLRLRNVTSPEMWDYTVSPASFAT